MVTQISYGKGAFYDFFSLSINAPPYIFQANFHKTSFS